MSREENENLCNYPIKTLLLQPPTVHVRLNASICKFFRPLVILTFIHTYVCTSIYLQQKMFVTMNLGEKKVFLLYGDDSVVC